MNETKGQDESLGKKTVKLAGLSFLAGDLALIGGGVAHALGKNGNKHELGNALTGLIWAQAGVAAGLFGDPNKAMQLRIHAHNLEEYLGKQGIEISDEVKKKNELLRDKGIGEKAERFISKHPTEVFNSIVGAASLGMVYSGAKALAQKNHVGANNMWAGLLVMAGAAGGLLIKEDPKAPEKAKHGSFIDKAVAYVREQPLRWSSTLYLLNDYFIINRAWGDYKTFKLNGDKRFIWPTIAAASNLLGNGLLFVSHRNQLKEGFSDAQVLQMEELGADTLLSQPAANRQHVAATIAHYIRHEKISDRSVDQLSREILDLAQKKAGLAAPQPTATLNQVEHEGRAAEPGAQQALA